MTAPDTAATFTHRFGGWYDAEARRVRARLANEETK